MTKEQMLRRLPQSLVVMDCAHCGRLIAASPGDAARYRAAGLRCLGGRVNDRPQCVECFHGVPAGRGAMVTDGRSEGQAAKLLKAD